VLPDVLRLGQQQAQPWAPQQTCLLQLLLLLLLSLACLSVCLLQEPPQQETLLMQLRAWPLGQQQA
jgi:hypothetical protein